MKADSRPMPPLQTPIDLAHEAQFTIAGLQVSPATREVRGPGHAEVLEPRVMQVLVALARRRDGVVSRDDLLQACWGGRAIGDDAIHRCIAKVRKLGEASGAFGLETIPRVGYRLTATEAAAPAAPAPEPAAEAGPVLAVLPFDNLSGDAELAFFSDGVSDEILHALSRNTNLRLIGRASSFQFRGPNKVVRNIAGELKTSHLLDGSVRRAGDRVRVSAHLIEAATQTMVWSDRFDRDLANIFALQDEIAAAVAAALHIRFAAPRAEPRVSKEAYDTFLRGAVWSRDVSLESQVRALMLLDEAVTQAPGLARAWGELALTRAQLRYIGAPQAAAITVPLIVEAAERAIAMDPRAQGAWGALYLATPPFAFMQAEALFERVRRVGFDLPLARAIHLMDVGRLREAQGELARAQSIDPFQQMQMFYCAVGELAQGDLDNAVRIVGEAVDRWPQVPFLSAFFTVWAAHASRWADVDRMLLPERLSRHPMGPWTERVRLQVDALRHGADATLFAKLRAAEAPMAASHVESAAFAGHLLGAAAVLADDAPVNLNAIRRPELGMAALFLPLYENFRRDPAFAAYCAKIGLAAYWTQTGAWPDCAEELSAYYDFRAACRAALA